MKPTHVPAAALPVLRGFHRASAAMFCVLCMVLALSFPPAARAGDSTSPDTRLEKAEEETRIILNNLELKLLEQLADTKQSFADAWRMRLIHAAMWGPFADISEWTLHTLGTSKTARDILFFAMPPVRWMSEPFIFPVETTGTPQEVEKETHRVFKLIARLHQQGLSTSLDNVGDASLSPQDAAAYQAYYRILIREFIKNDTDGQLNMSLKLSALVHDLDAAVDTEKPEKAEAKQNEIRTALAALLKTAAEAPDKDIFLRIDMEEYKFKDMTLRLYRDVVENNPGLVEDARGNLRLGVVIQAYLRDAGSDLAELAEWAHHERIRVPVRLVKGAYLNYERETAEAEGRKSPVWNFKPSTDANFEALCAWMLLNTDTIKPAFATHNLRSMAHVMALARVFEMPTDTLEFQMLYGMGDPIKTVVVDAGYAMRDYVPAGSFARGLAYAGRRFHELSNSNNALARTMRGDFSHIDGSAPDFEGDRDIRDGEKVMRMLKESLESAID